MFDQVKRQEGIVGELRRRSGVIPDSGQHAEVVQISQDSQGPDEPTSDRVFGLGLKSRRDGVGGVGAERVVWRESCQVYRRDSAHAGISMAQARKKQHHARLLRRAWSLRLWIGWRQRAT
jgi:hypothetical protein